MFTISRKKEKRGEVFLERGLVLFTSQLPYLLPNKHQRKSNNNLPYAPHINPAIAYPNLLAKLPGHDIGIISLIS